MFREESAADDDVTISEYSTWYVRTKYSTSHSTPDYTNNGCREREVHMKIKMPDGWRTIKVVSTQDSTSRSTRERNNG